jgi:type VI secretion system protein ImpA
MDLDASQLLNPISPEHPCGEDLEDTQLLASFDAYRIFGQLTPLGPTVNWREIRDRSLEALGSSRDLRLLIHLAAAVARTDGFAPFVVTVKAAAGWLETWWTEVYPRVDEDAVLRRNALSGLADRMAVIDGLRRIPILVHRQIGSFSIRDVEIASGHMPPGADDAQPPSADQLNALLAATETEALKGLEAQLGEVMQSLKSIEAIMRDRADSQSVPDFAPLLSVLNLPRTLIAAQLAQREPAANASQEASGDSDAGHGGGQPFNVGAIRSRDDAVRALDAVARYFRTQEPSSPIPLFLERAKRLVAKDFLTVLEDIAPDALTQAKSAGGVRD